MPCNPYNTANPVMGRLLYLFYCSKLFDFVDTLIIILGKKWKQLSLLHVYHHFSVFAVRIDHETTSYWTTADDDNNNHD